MDEGQRDNANPFFFFGQTQFPKRFGDIVAPDGCKDLSYPWQPGLPHSALIGQIAGLIIKSYAQAHFGRRATYIGAISFMAAAIFVPVFAPSLSVPASRVALCGLFMGHISSVRISGMQTNHRDAVYHLRLRALRGRPDNSAALGHGPCEYVGNP